MEELTDTEKLLFNEKKINFLMATQLLSEGMRGDGATFAAEVHNKMDTTSAHVIKTRDRMEKAGLIEVSSGVGSRKREFNLTKKGQNVVSKLREIREVCEDGL